MRIKNNTNFDEQMFKLGLIKGLQNLKINSIFVIKTNQKKIKTKGNEQ